MTHSCLLQLPASLFEVVPLYCLHKLAFRLTPFQFQQQHQQGNLLSSKCLTPIFYQRGHQDTQNNKDTIIRSHNMEKTSKNKCVATNPLLPQNSLNRVFGIYVHDNSFSNLMFSSHTVSCILFILKCIQITMHSKQQAVRHF